MRYDYGQYDGSGFQTPDSLFPSPQVMRFIMVHGEDALEAMENLEGDEEQQYIQMLIDAGLLEEYEDDEGNPRLRMTPKMIKGMQHRALLDVFEGMRKGVAGGHESRAAGASSERTEGTRAYEFGDPLSELDLASTLRNALHRHNENRARIGGGPAGGAMGGAALPLRLGFQDFELHESESTADCATVMLIDLSGSMYRFGRFLKAKQVAMGMAAMIRERFPRDTLDFVSFYSLADRVSERDLPLIMPKPVSIYDPVVRVRVPLEQARAQAQAQQAQSSQQGGSGGGNGGGSGGGGHLPLHFTNLQLGLREARRVLRRSGAANKQVFIITDGEPTAHVAAGPTGDDMLYLLYPPSEETADATLKEALHCQQQGIRLATFALTEDYFGMDWVGFVERMTRLTRGTAFYCSGEDLASTIVESYLIGKKRKSYIA
ncbi:MAG: hypothetical protein ACOC1G_06060 [Phycisphaeraceae bacterium]